MLLIVSDIVCITVKYFTHLEHTSSLSVFTPKIFWNFGNSINTDTIKVKFRYNSPNPIFKVLSNIGV
jgi:hypothetical protein